jgi:gamma-glutamyl:cysteine ligase YbdK (ATP-grasp superfamily)
VSEGGQWDDGEVDVFGDLPDEYAPPAAPADVDTLLRRVSEIVSNARPMPLSSSVMINRDEVVEMVEEALARLPEELQQARWLLKERDEHLARTRREAEEILDEARLQASRMVERTEVVRQADQTARLLVEEAEAHARRLRNEAEDFCDQRLAQFEIVLDRTMRTVQAGRSRLQTVPLHPDDEIDGEDPTAGFFDQDQT